MRIGYACINNTLAADKIKVNRSVVKRTFAEKGLPYVSGLALQNVVDLEKIIGWNVANDIFFYRMSSDMFPWMSEYELDDLPDINEIDAVLHRIGNLAASVDMRLTFHPGPFNVLASPSELVVGKTIKELRQHGEIMDKLALPRTPFAKINIHVGGAYGDKSSALARFAFNFHRVPDSARKRLSIENDDRPSMFSVRDLMSLADTTGIPVVFDYLHHKFCTGDLAEKEALAMAVSTWPVGITPVVHFSSAKQKFEEPSALAAAHANFIYESIPNHGYDLDVMLEAKAMELAVIRYRDSIKSIGTCIPEAE
jgi:UV DNA damage endonuclease